MSSVGLLNSTVKSSHAVIIKIPDGFGYEYLIKNLNINKESDLIKISPRIHGSQKTENINTEDIIDIQEKTRGISKNQQYYFILGADKMSESAQNKFLKLLEEPRDNLHFIMVTSRIEKLIITIRSRAQLVAISSISLEESKAILDKFKIDDIKTKQILFLANGLPGEIEKLATDRKYFSSNLKIMELAKKWVSGNTFDKVIVINDLKSNREQALLTISRTIELLAKTLEPGNYENSIRKASRLTKAYKSIQGNGNIRLNLIEATME